MKRIFFLIVATLCSVNICAQTPKPSPDVPNTKLETFQARSGVVVIKGFTRVGRLRGIGGSVEVLSMQFTDAQTARKEQGIVIEVSESGRLERSDRSFIDYDEIDSLLKGIEYVGKIDKSVTPMTNFEAKYATKGDFSIIVFNDSEGIQVAITSGRIGRVSVYLKLANLEEFKALLTTAKGQLDAVK